jgi:hypothetical protein
MGPETPDKSCRAVQSAPQPTPSPGRAMFGASQPGSSKPVRDISPRTIKVAGLLNDMLAAVNIAIAAMAPRP